MSNNSKKLTIMKKIMICMMAALMSLAYAEADAQPRKPKKVKVVKKVEVVAPSHRTFGSRTISAIPSKSIYVNFNGLQFIYDEGGRYYRKLAPSRFEIVRPPIGLLVEKIYKPKTIKRNKEKFYLVDGVLYKKVKTPHGKMYKVVGFM